MESNKTIVEERIRFIRERVGYTQKQVASALKISRSLVNNWEHGFANISLKQLIKLAYFYQVPIDYLLGIIDEVDSFPYRYVKEMDLKNIGMKLKNLRKSLGFTQEKFAQRIDTKRSSISYYEIGRMMISTADLKQICETFGVSADYLVGNLNDNIKREQKRKIKTKEIKEKIGN